MGSGPDYKGRGKWGQMAPMGAPKPEDLMQTAQRDTLALRKDWQAAKEAFQNSPVGSPARKDARAAMDAAQGRFENIQGWFQGLKQVPPSQQQGYAYMGPPIQWAPPQLAPTMAIPQFDGMKKHDGTMASLLEILAREQKLSKKLWNVPPPKTGTGTGTGGTGGTGSGSGWTPNDEAGGGSGS
jgi:hypothetical protein